MDFVVHVGIQSAEPEISIRIRDVAAYLIGSQIFQKYNAALHGRVALVYHSSLNGAELRFLLGILCACQADNQQEHNHERKAGAVFHDDLLLSRSIRNTT